MYEEAAREEEVIELEDGKAREEDMADPDDDVGRGKG